MDPYGILGVRTPSVVLIPIVALLTTVVMLTTSVVLIEVTLVSSLVALTSSVQTEGLIRATRLPLAPDVRP